MHPMLDNPALRIHHLPEPARQPEIVAAVSDVQIMVLEIPALIAQPLQVPRRISIRPEEPHPHIVINAVYPPFQPVKIAEALRADQARRSRYKNRLHDPDYCFPKVSRASLLCNAHTATGYSGSLLSLIHTSHC